MIGTVKKEDIIDTMTKTNYKEYYDQWKEMQKDKNYQGKRTYTEIAKIGANVAGETKYSIYNAIKDAENNLMGPADPTKESIEMFLTRAKFKSFGGSSTEEHLKYHNKIMQKYKPKIIIEIGFNTGISAANFLRFNPEITVISFDIMMRFYTNYAKWYLDKEFPGRHILIAGDSTITVPTFVKMFPNYKADLLYLDGSHFGYAPYWDAHNLYKFAKEETILIIDNTCPHRGLGINVYNSMLRAIQDDGIINLLDNIETGDYKDSFAICKYNIKKEDKFKTTYTDYKYMERRIECYYYTYLVQDTNDHNELIKLKKEIEEKIKERPDDFDMYVILEINKKMKEFKDFKNMSMFKKKGKIWVY